MYGRLDRGTFSIVAVDPERKYWGVAVSTKPRAVGATVPWAEWKVGAVATQAWSNFWYGPDGLALLRKGMTAAEVVQRLTRADSGRDLRQLGVVDRKGNAAAWTGKKCKEHALHVVGEGFSCQGNLLASDRVVHSMARRFEECRGTLATRLFNALVAGASEGGDRRGIESAALLVVHREPGFPRMWGERWIDLRVDQHRRPIHELGRILQLEENDGRKLLRRLARQRRRRASGT